MLKRRIARTETEDLDDMLRYVGVVSGELERVNHKVEMLLRLLRPRRAAEPSPLNELLEELQDIIVLEGSHREIAVRLEPASGAGRVRVPREIARQVILNLFFEMLGRLSRGDELSILTVAEGDEVSLVFRGTRTGRAGTALESETESHLPMIRMLAETVGGRIDDAQEAATGQDPAATSLSLTITAS